MRASRHTCPKSQVLHSKEAAIRTVGSRFRGLWIVAALWDRRDHTGELTPPGLFLLRVEVLGDARIETVTRVVGVAY